MAISYASTTNVLEHIELQRQNLSQMKVLLMQNSKTDLLALYTDVIAAMTTDKDTVTAATSVDKLTA